MNGISKSIAYFRISVIISEIKLLAISIASFAFDDLALTFVDSPECTVKQS